MACLKKKSKLQGKSEQEVYEKLGLQWIPPELRENTGEIEAAKKRVLPELVELKDLCGDLQVHSNWTDGQEFNNGDGGAGKKEWFRLHCNF